VIGENSLVAAGSVIGAGTVVGKNCLLGIHTITRPHSVICDHVVVGISSVVIKDLDKPGIYFGNPAVFKKEHPDNWMW
jgi:UDP-3-O-[3-hydroxymyristoyl] glucosamine N-acyltransferase